MKTVNSGSPEDAARAAEDNSLSRPAPAFHVELTPASAGGQPFHALHGTVLAAPVPHLPSHLEEVTAHPLGRP